MLAFGPLTLDTRLILAPMAGISDLPYREINRSFGCRFAFTEMISANSFVCRSIQTMKMLSTTETDQPLGIQLLGNDPGIIERALEILSGCRFSLLDFNAACPARKVAVQGQGAGLLKTPEKLEELLKLVVKRSPFPVTVKIRSGWDEQSVNAVDVACRAEDAGVKGITIHGRTREQGYSGSVDYAVIRQVKEAISIPVVASGDALSAPHIKRLFDETGCDGVAIARGALGNPWIFRETEAYLLDGTLLPRPNAAEITETMKKHLSLLREFHGERTGVILFRKFFTWYTKGYPVKELRKRAFHAETHAEMGRLIDAAGLLMQKRQMDPEDSSLPRSALKGDKAVVVPDDAIDDGKAEA